MARPQPKPLRSDEEAVSFVSGLVEYAHARGELEEAMKDGKRTTEELQSEAIEAMSKKGATTTLADSPELREWLRTRAKSIKSSARNRDRADGKLMRAYVLVEELVRRGVTLADLKRLELKRNSQAWLADAQEHRLKPTTTTLAKRKSIQEQLKPRNDRDWKTINPSDFYGGPTRIRESPVCERRGCQNQRYDRNEDGKIRKTKFVVKDEAGGKELLVCRPCITSANSLQDKAAHSGHLNVKDRIDVPLRGSVFENFCAMAIPSLAGPKKRKKTRERAGGVGVRGSGSGDDQVAKANDDAADDDDGKNKQKGTDADPILLSSSDDEDDKSNRAVMAVINPCQRQTRRSSKVEIETDPVLDKLKCFMPPEGGRGSIKFALRDYFKLRPMEFLNDSCIDYFMKSIEIRLKEEMPAAWERCYFFNSFFYKKLTDNQSVIISDETKALAGMPLGDMDEASLQALRCYDLTKNWTKHVDLFAKDFLFIPICEHLHWSLLIVCHPGRGVIKDPLGNGAKLAGTFMIHLDSMRSHKSFEMGKLVKMYLQNEWKAKLRQDDDSAAKRWQAAHPGETRDFLKMTVRRPYVPPQDNHFDCGLFLCVYVDQFLAYLPRTMNEAKVPTKVPRNATLRQKLMKRNKRFFPRRPMFLTHRWFSTNDVGNLRTDLATRVLRAMAVNAGVMDHHAKWKTDDLTEEQQHMLAYLMNQLEILADRKESYDGPEWLEVLTDEEEEYGEVEIDDDSDDDSDDDGARNGNGGNGGKRSNDEYDDNDIVLSLDDLPKKMMTTRTTTAAASTAANAGSDLRLHALPDIDVDDPIEDPEESKTPKDALAAILRNKTDRDTPDVQATTERHTDGTISIFEEQIPQTFQRKNKKNKFAVRNRPVSVIGQRTGVSVTQSSRGAKIVKTLNDGDEGR